MTIHVFGLLMLNSSEWFHVPRILCWTSLLSVEVRVKRASEPAFPDLEKEPAIVNRTPAPLHSPFEYTNDEFCYLNFFAYLWLYATFLLTGQQGGVGLEIRETWYCLSLLYALSRRPSFNRQKDCCSFPIFSGFYWVSCGGRVGIETQFLSSSCGQYNPTTFTQITNHPTI